MSIGDLVIYKPHIASAYGGPGPGKVGLIVSESLTGSQSDITKFLVKWPDGREWYMTESWLEVVSGS